MQPWQNPLFLHTLDEQREIRVVAHHSIEYPGEVIVARQWQDAYAYPLSGDTYFRIVLLRQRQRLAAVALTDSRIAICVPGRGLARKREEISRELHALREAGATYVTRQEPGIASLRRTLEERVRDLEQTLVSQEGHSYAIGDIYTRIDVSLQARDIFTGTDPEEWVTRAAQALLSWTYPDPPLNPQGFPRPLRPPDARMLFDALFAPDEAPGTLDLLEGFGPGLGLSTSDNPQVPNTRGCPVFALVSAELDRRPGEVPSSTILTQLAHGYGLTNPLASLYMLAFIHFNQPAAELVLKPDHQVLLRTGELLPGDRLAGEAVTNIQWPEDLSVQVVALRRTVPLSWNVVAPYASVLDATLAPARSPSEEQELGQRLLNTLSQLKRRVTQVREALAQLSQSLGGLRDRAAEECLVRLERVAQVSHYQEFFSRANDLFGSVRGLQRDVTRLQQMEVLADHSAETQQSYSYLREVQFHMDYPELELERTTLLAQLDFATLVQNPGRWEGLRLQFQGFRSGYAKAYAAHHDAYHKQSTALERELGPAELKAQAPQRLNAIPELGEPAGIDIPQRLQEVRSTLKVCTIRRQDLPLDRHPVCQTCDLVLGETLLYQEAQRVLTGLEDALDQQNRRLASRVVGQVLGQQRKPELERFIRVVQVSGLSGLANVLDDNLVSLIRELLHQP